MPVAALAWVAQLVSRRHDRALHSLFCDEQASEHYGLAARGAAHLLWRVRVYVRGFLVG
ncbi:hypothetical protein [Methylibium petroleiphilum]|uniref:hypothetical protein n=1 Tax=Methylibium petroleiphilum TaxID=105560 RepID=UPI00003CD1DA|nr:hypothetical protein [Methylibium petroleiphilum]